MNSKFKQWGLMLSFNCELLSSDASLFLYQTGFTHCITYVLGRPSVQGLYIVLFKFLHYQVYFRIS
jgi:hypothetical protein